MLVGLLYQCSDQMEIGRSLSRHGKPWFARFEMCTKRYRLWFVLLAAHWVISSAARGFRRTSPKGHRIDKETTERCLRFVFLLCRRGCKAQNWAGENSGVVLMHLASDLQEL